MEKKNRRNSYFFVKFLIIFVASLELNICFACIRIWFNFAQNVYPKFIHNYGLVVYAKKAERKKTERYTHTHKQKVNDWKLMTVCRWGRFKVFVMYWRCRLFLATHWFLTQIWGIHFWRLRTWHFWLLSHLNLICGTFDSRRLLFHALSLVTFR